MHTMSKGQLAFTIAIAAIAAILAFNGMAAEGLMTAMAGVVTLEDVATQFATKSAEFGALGAELKESHVELKAKTERGENVSRELKESVDQMLTKFNTMAGTLNELEQKLSEGVNADQKTAKTWGEQIVGSNEFKAFSPNNRTAMRTEVKQVTSAAAGGLIRSYREADVVSLQRERRVMRDLLRTIPVDTSSVDYAVQTTRTNLAAPVAEGAQKPYSDYAWGSATVAVRTLAHLAKITRQAMDDAPRLIGELDQEMRYGLGLVEERQFLYGTGVGQNLHGIVPQATAFAKPVGYVDALATRIDVLRLAMLQVSLGLLPSDGIVLNELDWALIELTKTTDGGYMFANPQGKVSANMWGLPVVATPAMDAGDFLVGSFQMGATVYDRMGVEVLISTENDTDFELNLATMRAEERVAIAVKRPQAFITGEFGAAVASIKV